MPEPSHLSGKLKLLVLILMIAIAAWGGVMVFAEVKPFWIDEWRLILNLKFKSPQELWGALDFTQQFPRVFLQVLKWFTATFDYSYLSLRMPSWLIALCSMVLCWRLMLRLFPDQGVNRYLFVLILISSQTFTDYIVQIKHYEMEIFLSLVAIWQLLELEAMANGLRKGYLRYLLLCLSFPTVTFFSYTYPIAVAPVYIIFALQVLFRRNARLDIRRWVAMMVPLVLGAIGIMGFYILDVSQLMKDPEMHSYWQYRMMGSQFRPLEMLENIWGLFARVGSGFVYEIVFGVLGISAVVFWASRRLKRRQGQAASASSWMKDYSLLLLMMVIVLFFAGKLPAGEAKFNAFTVPAIAYLIIALLNRMQQSLSNKLPSILTTILYLGLAGNIVSVMINTFSGPIYHKRMRIYHATEQAIRTAQAQRLPIFVTTGVAYPDDIVRFAPYLKPVTAAQVLSTFPAYDASRSLPVYSISSLDELRQHPPVLPSGRRYLAGDGERYQVFDLHAPVP